MKFTCSIQISLPREKVVELWKNESFFAQWQDGFQSKKWIEGKAYEVGAKAEILIQQNNQKIELLETVIENSLPDVYLTNVEHEHMDNTFRNKFTAIGENLTLWEAEIHYTRFKGFLPKLMAKLFPGMFKKQTQKWLDNFKKFSEGLG